MSKFLKGNYPLEDAAAKEPEAPKPENLTAEFEEKALEKLGGSIAFVMKSNTFVWDGEEEN